MKKHFIFLVIIIVILFTIPVVSQAAAPTETGIYGKSTVGEGTLIRHRKDYL